MKKLLLAASIALPLTANAGAGFGGDLADVADQTFDNIQGGVHGIVGIAAIEVDKFAGIDDNETKAVPLINVTYNDTYYFQFNKLGAWCYKHKYSSKYSGEYAYRLGVVALPRKGYDLGDGPIATHEVDDQALVGLRGKFRSGRFSMDSSLLTSTESDSGAEWQMSMNYTIAASQLGTITVFGKAEVLSEDAVDYLYYANGQYEGAESAANFSYGFLATYSITNKLGLIGSISSQEYDDAIKDAPGVTESHNETAMLGVTYKF